MRIEMELTLGAYGVRANVLREEAEEKANHIMKQVHCRISSEPYSDHQKEYLQLGSSRYAGSIRWSGQAVVSDLKV